MSTLPEILTSLAERKPPFEEPHSDREEFAVSQFMIDQKIIVRLCAALERALHELNQEIFHYELLVHGAAEKSQERIASKKERILEILGKGET